MTTLTTTNTFTSGSLARASEVNQNFTDVRTWANGNVDGATNITAGGVTTAALADSGVTTAKIADLGVTSEKLATDAVTTAKIADSAVTTAKINDSAVTTAKINNNAVDGTKIAMGSDAQGDILYYNGTDYVRLGPGTAGQFLRTGGAGANPSWAAPAEGELAAASVDQATLKTSQGTVTSDSGTWNSKTVPGGEHGFYPQVRDTAGGSLDIRIGSGGVALPTSYTSILHFNGGSGTLGAQQRYITASGKDHWVFVMVAAQDFDELDVPTGVMRHFTKGQILGGYEAPDHPSVGNGGDETKVPHPFPEYWTKSLPSHRRIVLVDHSVIAPLLTRRTRDVTVLDLLISEYTCDGSEIVPYTPREIIEIDEDGSKRGEVIREMPTPEFAKLIVKSDRIQLKRRIVEQLPSAVLHARPRRRP